MIRILLFILLILSPSLCLAQPARIERNIARSKATLALAEAEEGWRDGELIQTQGYDSAGDGGGERYRFRSSGWSSLTATQQNQTGWYVRIGASDKYLEAVDKSTVWLRKWGCGASGDQSVRLQAAVDAARNQDVWVDGEGLTVTGHLLIQPNAIDAKLKMKNLRIENSDWSYAVKVDGTTWGGGYSAAGIHFNRVEFSASQAGASGLILQGCHFLEGIDNCAISGSKVGLELIECFVGKITNSTFGGKYPVYGHKSGPSGGYTGLHVYDSCTFTSSSINVVYDNDGYSFDDAYGCTFRNCTTQGPSSLKYYFRDSGQFGSPMVLDNCYFESPLTVTVDASDIGLGTIDPANGGFVQATNSKLRVTNGIATNIGLYSNSRAEITDASGNLYKDASSLFTIDKYVYYSGLDQAFNLDAKVRYIIENQYSSINITKSYYAPTSFDPTVTNLVNPEQNGAINIGTPVLTRIAGDGSRLTSAMQIQATAGDSWRIDGNAFAGYLQDPSNSKFILVQMMVRAVSGSPRFALGRDVGGKVNSITASQEWQGVNMLISPVSNNRQRLGFYAVDDGTFQVADISVTAWDTQEEVNAWVDANRMAGTRPYRIPLVFDTLSAATASKKLVNGDEVVTNGYASAGDGGGNKYVYRSTGRSSITVDGGFYIAGSGSDDYLEAVDKSSVDYQKFGGDVNDFGADFDSLATLAETLDRALVLPSGTLNLTTGGVTHTVTGNLKIVSKGKTTLTINGGSPTGIAFSAPLSTTTTLSSDVEFGDMSINVASADGISVGQVIWLTTSTPVDTSYGYTKNMCMKVSGISGTNIRLSEPSNFDFTVAETTVRIYDYATVEIQDVIFSHANLKRTDFNYLAGLKLIDCEIEGANISTDGWFIRACNDVVIDRPKCRLSRYSIMVSSGTRNTVISDLFADGVRHPVDGQTWAYNIRVIRARGVNCQTIIQCHPCFEVWFEECSDNAQEGSASYGMRCIGGGLIDCTLAAQGSSPPAALGGIALLPDYEYIQSKYDKYFIRVKSLTQELSGSYCRDIIFEDCYAPFYSVDGFSAEVTGKVIWRGVNRAFNSGTINNLRRIEQRTERFLPEVTPTDGFRAHGTIFDIASVSQANPAKVTLTRTNLVGASDAGTDTIELVAHGLTNGQQVEFLTNTPPPLVTGTLYYVVNATADDFQVEASPGSGVIDITFSNLNVNFLGVPTITNIFIDGIAGMTEVNQQFFAVSNVKSKEFELTGVDSSGYTAYSSGGKATISEACKEFDRRKFIGTSSNPFRFEGIIRANDSTIGSGTSVTIPVKLALVNTFENGYRTAKIKVKANSINRGYTESEYVIRCFTGITSATSVSSASNTITSGTITAVINNVQPHFASQVDAQGGSYTVDYPQYYVSFDVVVTVSASSDDINRVRLEVEEFQQGT